MKKSLLLVLAALVLASLACNMSGLGLPGSAPAEDSGILFQDDFSSSTSGWDSVRDNEAITDYENGSYRIWVNKTNYNYWANPGLGDKLPGDVSVEVEAFKLAGPDVNSYGVMCRYTVVNDMSNFYYFAVSSDGYEGIFKVQNSEESLLSDGKGMKPSSQVHPGAAMNRIRAVCVGNTLTLYVNGQQVDSVTDDSLSNGDAGLIAGSYDEVGVDVSFDNFKVTKP